MAPAFPARREATFRATFRAPAPTRWALAVAAAPGLPVVDERVEVRLDGRPVPAGWLADAHGTRLLALETGAGELVAEYRAVVAGLADPAPVDPLDALVYVRPSRYVPSDALAPLARSTFPGLAGVDLLRAVGDWVFERLVYDPAATEATGGAAETLERGAGVCRDYAHLVAALLRGLDVPARVVSVYAPQLDPPDFHAVVEALVDGRWLAVDATRLAPRRGMLRIATGRDAADTAWASNAHAEVELVSLEVAASADVLLTEDPAEPVELC